MQGEGQYRCEKCQVTKSNFTWRMILQVNMADTSDNVWATCFQVNKLKLQNVFQSPRDVSPEYVTPLAFILTWT